MENTWNNHFYNEKIQVFYSNFQNGFKEVIHRYCEVIDDLKILQLYPNKFSFNSFQIEFFINEDTSRLNSISIELPSVRIVDDELYFSKYYISPKSDVKIYFALLRQEFNRQQFRSDLSELFNILYHNYTDFISSNFVKIRDNYFQDFDRIINDYEKQLFEKPPVILRCEVSKSLTHYGYKPGEGRNYVHSYSIKYTDIHNYPDTAVQTYIKTLNLSNPKEKDVDNYEMSPGDYSDTLQIHYDDLDLSQKINWYIKTNKKNNDVYDYNRIDHKPIVRKNPDNFAFFQSLIIIYIITKFDLATIVHFFQDNKKQKNHLYKNLIFISQYFLNRKGSYYRFLNEFDNLRKQFISILRDKNFVGSDKLDKITLAFDKINGDKNDLLKLKYFYINYLNRNKNEDIINYDVLFFIIRDYFKS